MRAQLSIVGRVGRKTFWTVIGVLVLTVVLTAVPAVLLTRLGGICIPIGNGLMSLVLILCGWVSIANQVKRWHDLGRSGWMVFISLVPIVGFLINLICLGFLPGQVGSNRFGPPPGTAGRGG